MNKQKYPLSKAIELSKKMLDRVPPEYSWIVTESKFHDIGVLIRFCEKNCIRLIWDRNLPGSKRKAAVINVFNTPYIIMDPSLNIKSEYALRALAHEIAHILLGHLNNKNFAAFGFSETMNEWDATLQIIYCTQMEVEAELLGMMIVVPDRLLDVQVEKTIFIPARRKAHEHGIDTRWIAARIQLYRLMYGYEKSKHLLRQRCRDKISQPDPDRWFSLERTENNDLEIFLPEIDSSLIGMV